MKTMDNLKLFNNMFWVSIVIALSNAAFGNFIIGNVWLAIAAVYLVGESIIKEIRSKK